MNSRPSRTKRVNSDVNPLPSHGMLTRSKTQGNANAKRRRLETNPLKIPHIMEQVLSFLDVESIKLARQVTKLWSIEGAKLLIEKCFIYLPFEFRFYESSNNEIKTFRAFLSYKANEVFMIPNIAVFDTRDTELWKSFGVLGNQVTNLKVPLLNYKNDWLPQLLDLLPNLKYLNFELQRVIELSVSKRRQILTSIMSKAEKDQNPLVISSMFLFPESMEELEEIEKFATYNNIMIEELKFEFCSEDFDSVPQFEYRIANLVSKLLATNQNTFKWLCLHECEMYLHLLDFPVLTTLIHMHLTFGSGPLRRYEFPGSFRFSEKIPNLQNIGIHYVNTNVNQRSYDFFGSLLKNTGPAPSVKTVRYHDGFLDFEIGPFFEAFPNIEDFQSLSGYSEKTFNSIWKHGQNLKKLYLQMSLNQPCGNVADLDSLLTGFSQSIVNQINMTWDWNPTGITHAESSRVNPSILMLKDLENLTISINGWGSKKPPKRMLAVAGEYAFTLMPKDAKIVIRFKDFEPGFECAKKALDKVSKHPNVTCEFVKLYSNFFEESTTDVDSDDSS